MISDKIRLHHLERKALLYVRQSSAHQVLHNRESSALQTSGGPTRYGQGHRCGYSHSKGNRNVRYHADGAATPRDRAANRELASERQTTTVSCSFRGNADRTTCGTYLASH